MWNDLFRHYIRNMKDHCEAGRKLPEGISAEVAFDRKKKLLLTVNEFLGSEEFEEQKKKFSEHVKEFVVYHNLQLSIIKEKEPCKPRRQ